MLPLHVPIRFPLRGSYAAAPLKRANIVGLKEATGPLRGSYAAAPLKPSVARPAVAHLGSPRLLRRGPIEAS